MKQNTKETIADIVAQIRAAAYCPNADSPESVFRLADRIEAAWERERERNADDLEAVGAVAAMDAAKRELAPGNAAALREALCNLINASFKVILLYGNANQEMRTLAEANDNSREPLAVSARNCDRFATLEEARKAFYSGYFGPTEAEDIQRALLDWLFAPAAGGKGSEAANV